MKKIIYSLPILLLLVSCSDFLNLRPEGTVESVGLDYTKAENVFKPVSAAYASLRAYGVHGFPYIAVFGIASDDDDKGSTPEDNPEAASVDNFTFGASLSFFDSIWTEYYNTISAANNAISQMDSFEKAAKNEEVLRNIEICRAESRFIRAYAYFNLVRAFGRVPIIDKAMDSEQMASLKQAAAQEVYAFIEDDLKFAVETLPESWTGDNLGRVTRYSALGLLAKVSLYEKKYEEAVDYCDQIMASGKFFLNPDFRKLFSIEGENCAESLFEIQNSELGRQSGTSIACLYSYYKGPRSNSPSNMQGWGFDVPSDGVIKFFEDRGETVRYNTTFLFRGSTTPEGDHISENCPNRAYTGKGYIPSQYNTWSSNGYGRDYNIRILRYAEILLIYAESSIRSGKVGTLSGYSAQAALDELRTRAKMPSIAPTLENILEERRAELCMEEDRFCDLVRTGDAAKVLSVKGFKVGKNELFPIPANQLQLNNNLTQNPGY